VDIEVGLYDFRPLHSDGLIHGGDVASGNGSIDDEISLTQYGAARSNVVKRGVATRIDDWNGSHANGVAVYVLTDFETGHWGRGTGITNADVACRYKFIGNSHLAGDLATGFVEFGQVHRCHGGIDSVTEGIDRCRIGGRVTRYGRV